MTRTCPNCGRQAIDDQSQFCNKCGTPFPADQPKKVLVRTTPRLVDTAPPPPPPPVQQPVAAQPAPEYYAPPPPEAPAIHAPPPARSYAEPPRVRAPVKPLVRRQPVMEKPLPFKKLIAKDHPRLVYWLGVIAILLIVIAGVMADQSKTTKTGTATDTSSDTAGKDTASPLAGIPLIWIGVFIFANLFWRVLCETGAALFVLHENQAVARDAAGAEQEDLFGMENAAGSKKGSDEMVECPRCGKIVPAEELETCAECGIQGCSSCVRKMGLLKSKWTCRDCYQKK